MSLLHNKELSEALFLPPSFYAYPELIIQTEYVIWSQFNIIYFLFFKTLNFKLKIEYIKNNTLFFKGAFCVLHEVGY